jgi:hypothetical protein
MLHIIQRLKKMNKGKMRMLVSILKESPLYITLTHEEKMSLLLGLAEEYPSLINQLN